jgi:hypothetical protein
MLLVPLLTLAAAAASRGAPVAGDAFWMSEGTVCLATGYCAAPGPASSGGPPGGVMYLALGLVGTGLTVLRAERRIRSPEP